VSADGGRDIQQGLIDYVANFTASVYQLGSFGAARKELQALSLTP